jgi:hypothetical protein
LDRTQSQIFPKETKMKRKATLAAIVVFSLMLSLLGTPV